MPINKTDFPVLQKWMLQTVNSKVDLPSVISVYVMLSFLNSSPIKYLLIDNNRSGNYKISFIVETALSVWLLNYDLYV